MFKEGKSVCVTHVSPRPTTLWGHVFLYIQSEGPSPIPRAPGSPGPPVFTRTLIPPRPPPGTALHPEFPLLLNADPRAARYPLTSVGVLAFLPLFLEHQEYTICV